jgi:hypothetical protein
MNAWGQSAFFLRYAFRIKMETDSMESASINLNGAKKYILVGRVAILVITIMIPVRLMIPAPLSIGIHFDPVSIDLVTVLPMTADILIYSHSIRFQPPVAIIFIVSARTSDSGIG